jgi:hypothetical protein
MIELIILGLAVFRLTRLLTRDVILDELRERIWSRFPPERSKIGYLFTCEWCLSIWTGSLLYLSSILMPTTTSVIATVLALSAVAGLLAAYEDR